MQWAAKKRGQLGLDHAAAQSRLRSTRLSQAAEQRASEVVDVLGSAVGQGKLAGMPRGFDGVELWSVGGQALQVQSRIFAQQISQGLRVVDGGAVAHYD